VESRAQRSGSFFRDPSVSATKLEHFHGRCRVGRTMRAWFSLKENHTAHSFRHHSNCENALVGPERQQRNGSG
jgi:hypothetical protein